MKRRQRARLCVTSTTDDLFRAECLGLLDRQMAYATTATRNVYGGAGLKRIGKSEMGGEETDAE
jgi:hypothetical protein